MIDVTLKRKNNNVVGFTIGGHADFSDNGNDIVCSAVSILAYSTVNTLDLYISDLDFSDDGKEMKVIVNSISNETEIIFRFFETGILTLLESYNEYVNLNYMEV